MTVSLWQRREPRADKSVADVVVIGGGISGLSAAMEFESRGMSVTLIEQDFVGSRASGRNAGYLMRGAAENYWLACQELGRERAGFLWRWTEANLAALRALGVDRLPGYAARGSCLAAMDAEEAGELERSAGLMREDGFRVEMVRGGDDVIWRSGRVRVGLVNPDDAVCSPVELVGLLRSALRTTRVLTASRVYGMEREGSGVLVRAREHEVSCGRVLVCTNAYARELLPGLAGVVEPNRGQMFAFRPEDARLARLTYAYYLNRGGEYMRSGPDGTVVFGGARRFFEQDERTDGEGLHPGVQARLEAFVRELVTDRFEVIARWSGIMGFSPDGVPVVDAVDAGFGRDGRVWFCGGLTGHGMSMGHVTARHAARVMLDGGDNFFALGGRGGG